MSKKNAPPPDEAQPPQSAIVIEFAGPGMAFHQIGFIGVVALDQIAVAAAHLRVISDIMMANRERVMMEKAEESKIQTAPPGFRVPPGEMKPS